MNSEPSNENINTPLVSAVVEATLNQNYPRLNKLLKTALYDTPIQEPESLRAQIARNFLIQVAQGLEESVGAKHHILAWFMVYVGLGSAPPEAIQAAQMVLDEGLKPFADFFVDRQGIHFYNHGDKADNINKIPPRLSEFTQMTVRISQEEVQQVMGKYSLSEEKARQVVLNLKILEQKMHVPFQQLLTILDANEALLNQVMTLDLSQPDKPNRFGM
ncbi:MAG: hypothetical protein RIM23_21810 [Coleofasciculus sp. G3-WIS-01]|uniref:hypothetical protein n=1 Tax=Coleofasciculus sp. G3-WIS-01 TaxID=3069528 RepID=UPI0032F9BF07